MAEDLENLEEGEGKELVTTSGTSEFQNQTLAKS